MIITFRKGTTSVQFNVSIVDDSNIESLSESFQVQFQIQPESERYAETIPLRSTATIRIEDDDSKSLT